LPYGFASAAQQLTPQAWHIHNVPMEKTKSEARAKAQKISNENVDSRFRENGKPEQFDAFFSILLNANRQIKTSNAWAI